VGLQAKMAELFIRFLEHVLGVERGG